MEDINVKSLYVEGLPFSLTKEELEKFFDESGEVEYYLH